MMPIFRVALPNITDPARIDAFLTGRGYLVSDGSSIHSDGSISVNVDRDPSADLAAYVDTPTPTEQAKTAAVAAVKSYLLYVNAIPVATRTKEQVLLTTLIALLPGVTA